MFTRSAALIGCLLAGATAAFAQGSGGKPEPR